MSLQIGTIRTEGENPEAPTIEVGAECCKHEFAACLSVAVHELVERVSAAYFCCLQKYAAFHIPPSYIYVSY